MITAQKVRLRLWPERYVVARLRAVPADFRLPSPEGPPVCLVVGHGEVSVLAPEALVSSFGDEVQEISPGWRAVTIESVISLATVGLLAAASRALAQVGVPVMAFASHDTDHFLIPGAMVGRALAALNQVELERFLPPPVPSTPHG
jgi:hypothetical protein